MILHIPHASRRIPAELRGQFILDDSALEEELLLVTDAFTDELFEMPGAVRAVFPVSRLVVDAERFPLDRDEPMSRAGQGMIYTMTCRGEPLRGDLSQAERQRLKSDYYNDHHERLRRAVLQELLERGSALIVDCHSFPSVPLPCDEHRDTHRPDFCIGSDVFHTPEAWVPALQVSIEKLGHSVGINTPYAGTLVPSAWLRKNPNVRSVMIEVNRRLYMDETSGVKTAGFEPLKHRIRSLLDLLAGL